MVGQGGHRRDNVRTAALCADPELPQHDLVEVPVEALPVLGEDKTRAIILEDLRGEHVRVCVLDGVL